MAGREALNASRVVHADSYIKRCIKSACIECAARIVGQCWQRALSLAKGIGVAYQAAFLFCKYKKSNVTQCMRLALLQSVFYMLHAVIAAR